MKERNRKTYATNKIVDFGLNLILLMGHNRDTFERHEEVEYNLHDQFHSRDLQNLLQVVKQQIAELLRHH
jgi:hypothetical protein